MIKIKYTKDDEGYFIGVKITGHSLQGTEEHKIVCNSVSVASQMVAFSINSILGIHCILSYKTGDFEIDLEGKRTSETDLLMKSLKFFLNEIKLNYSKHLEISENILNFWD